MNTSVPEKLNLKYVEPCPEQLWHWLMDIENKMNEIINYLATQKKDQTKEGKNK